MTLRDLLEDAARSTDATAALDPDGAVTWTIGGTPFARLDATATCASFRLDGVLAAAATRTPDTRASSLGGAWVEFAPVTLDAHAEDRARAWFAAAARRAAG